MANEAGVAAVDCDRYEALGGWWWFRVKLGKDISESAATLVMSDALTCDHFDATFKRPFTRDAVSRSR